MSNIEQYLIFGHAAQAGSFSRAAEQLGVSNSHISKHIARLEQQLGYKLFHRSPKLQLTDSGSALLPEVNTMITAYEALNAVAPSPKGEVSGIVRIGIPPLLSREAVLPGLAALLEEHPKLRLEIHVQQSTLQAFNNNLDLVVTMGSLPDSSLVSQRIGECDALLVATPTYLERHGRPKQPEDLLRHRCIASHFPHFENSGAWQFQKGEEQFELPINTPVVTNDTYAIRQLIEDHFGIGVMLNFFVGEELEQGLFEQVLADYRFAIKPPLYIVYHDRELMPKSVKLMKNFLTESIRHILS